MGHTARQGEDGEMDRLATTLKYALCLLALAAIILLPGWLPHLKESSATVAHTDSQVEAQFMAGAS
jgi:hypothetical protein